MQGKHGAQFSNIKTASYQAVTMLQCPADMYLTNKTIKHRLIQTGTMCAYSVSVCVFIYNGIYYVIYIIIFPTQSNHIYLLASHSGPQAAYCSTETTGC